MRIRLLAVAALVIAATGVAALQLAPRSHAHTASPDSYLCVYGTTQDVEGTRITTATVCIPWI